MAKSVYERITDAAINKGYIKNEQKEEYEYGLNLIANIFITDITLLAIGFIMHMLWQCVVFWFIYKLLRKYCGGYHFSTYVRCYLSTVIMCIIVLLWLKHIPYAALQWSIITVSSAVILFVLSPVEAINKPLDADEKRVFGKISRVLILTVVGLYAASYIIGLYDVSETIGLSMMSISIFAVTGKLYNTVKSKEIEKSKAAQVCI